MLSKRKNVARLAIARPHSSKSRQTGRLSRVAARLLGWFGVHARDLPWRRTRDPYAIWVSEIMLQQTQVKTVIPYWECWMRELPTLRALARATPEKVLKLWEGLGYYARARNLQKAAQVIMAEHGGRFPPRFDDVISLPGVGHYTAGAICSIAFDQPAPVLDGNVIRVLTRLFNIVEDPRGRSVNQRLWQLAERLVLQAASMEELTRHSKLARFGHGSCSQLNQALMELGAVICTPRQPECQRCPLRQHCMARREGRAETLPRKRPQTSATARRFVALVAEHNGRCLVRQRPAGVINARLWEFPNHEVDGTHADLQTAARDTLGQAPASLQPLCTVRHSITRYRITLEAFRARLSKRPRQRVVGARWLRPGELERLAFVSAHRRILEHLRNLPTDGMPP
jgi:A/G-specific adenine glycosylase